MNNPPWIRQRPLNRLQRAVRFRAQAAILDAVLRAEGSIDQAAKSLGLNRTHLSRLITDLKLRTIILAWKQKKSPSRVGRSPFRRSYRDILNEATRRTIIGALTASHGNATVAAERLGMSRDRMLDYIKLYHLRKLFPAVRGKAGWRK